MARIPGIPTTVLVAPDSFKGTLTAAEVADAIGRGLEAEGRPVDLCPVADGGEGTLEALLRALDGERRTAPATDPLGRPIEAAFGIGEASRGKVLGIVETAAASGLGLVDPAERDPAQASTFGTGQLIMAAIEAGANLVYLGVGGSAITDGGAGAIRAIREAGGLGGARITALTGAGGLSGGLWAEFGAELVPGAQFVLDAVDFDRRMRAARAVVTGEGKLDQRSLAGKVVSEVSTRARQSGVPCHAIVGTRELDSFGVRVLDLQAVFEAGTPRTISAAARRLAEVL